MKSTSSFYKYLHICRQYIVLLVGLYGQGKAQFAGLMWTA